MAGETTEATGESTGAPATGETPTPADMPGATGQATGAESHADGSTGTGEGEGTGDGTDATGDQGSEGKGEGGKATALKAARTEAREAKAALTATRKAYAESMAADLHMGADLWLDGATIDRVLDDQGNVSPDLVSALATEQLGKRPGLRNTRPRPETSQHGAGGAGNSSLVGGGSGNINSWSGAAKATKNHGYDSRL